VKGKGWIVKKEWVEDSHSQRKRLLCLPYSLTKDPPSHLEDLEIFEAGAEDKSSTSDVSRRQVSTSVADPDPNPDPPDPHVFGPPGSGSGSISQQYGSGSGSIYH
jgi:hypothetical protein